MIVDDHADMRRVLRDTVKNSFSEVIEITEYETGENAIEDYPTLKPDWVLMDIELKSMSGFEVSEAILSLDKSAKIIIVTSYETPFFRRKAKQLNTYGFVCKDNLSNLQQLLLNN